MAMTLLRRFVTIDIDRHGPTCIAFRRDLYEITSGSSTAFDKDWGGDARYLAWLGERAHRLPDGCVMLLEGDRSIGMVEASLHPDGQSGYVSAFYLVSERRGAGLGELLMEQASTAFLAAERSRMRLSVAERNQPALAFYRRLGFEDHGPRPGRDGVRVLSIGLGPSGHPADEGSGDDTGGLDGWSGLWRSWQGR
jgi:ribosomal-protein-alanine N-acetyltransferase